MGRITRSCGRERYPVKPMFIDEAVLQLEMSHRQFIVFMNPRSSRDERALSTQGRRVRADRADRELGGARLKRPRQRSEELRSGSALPGKSPLGKRETLSDCACQPHAIRHPQATSVAEECAGRHGGEFLRGAR